MRDDNSKMELSLANSVDRKPSTIDHGERRKRATARVVEVVARCLVLGLRPAVIARRLMDKEPECMGILGFSEPPSAAHVRSWARRAAEGVSTLGEDVKAARSMAVARLDCTLAPLIERIEAAAEAGEADLRAIEQLRRVVATQAEIQGVTRARESLADALEGAMRSLVERSRREGTIRSASPNPPALRSSPASTDIHYRLTAPDAETLKRETASRRPGAIASTLVNSGAPMHTVSGAVTKAKGEAIDADPIPT